LPNQPSLTETHCADKLPSAALHSFTDRNTQFQDIRKQQDRVSCVNKQIPTLHPA